MAANSATNIAHGCLNLMKACLVLFLVGMAILVHKNAGNCPPAKIIYSELSLI